MKSKWFLIAVLFPALSFSQGSASGSSFHTIVSAGVVAGESTAKPLFQLSSGFNYDRWFTGIGVGVDHYNLKSVPVFADGRFYFGKTASGFVYANGGYNFPYGNQRNEEDFFKTSDRFSGGIYMDAGLGYRVRLNSWQRLLFSAGYSRKNIVHQVGYTYPCLVEPCQEEVYKYHYSLGRITAKLSWGFGK